MARALSPQALHPGEELIAQQEFMHLYSTLHAAPAATAFEDTAPSLRSMPRSSPSPIRIFVEAPLVETLPMPTRSPGAAEAGRTPAPSCSREVAALEAEIDRCDDRRHVARLAVHLARAYASGVSLLLVHRGMIEGLEGEAREQGLLFPAHAETLFADVAEGAALYRGAPPRGGLDTRVLRVLGCAEAQELAVLPVAIRGRVVNLLCADNGPEALGDASLAALATVCARVARAYERLIHARKRAAWSAA